MAPLTSPTGCVSCSRFAERITELEGRISTLYQIREAEMLMDTITFGPAQSAPLCASGSDAAPSGPVAAPEAAEAAPPSVPAAAAADPPPDTVSDDSWIRQGAKPRALTSSTPSDPESWCLAPALGRRGRRSSHAPHHNIQLENKFAPLAFPPVDEAPERPPPPSPSPSQRSHGLPSPPRSSIAIRERPSLRKTLRSIPLFTPAPRRAPAPSSVSPSPATSSPLVKSPPLTASPTSSSHETPHSASPRPLFPPTTAIFGDSTTRHIRFFNAVTHCFPGATVPVFLQKLPDLLNKLPSSIHRIVVHLGINDSSLRHSEVTKSQFRKLLQLLTSTGKSIFISGPLSPHGCGIEKFSRVLYFHTWLQSVCRALSVCFIDNFNLFWNRQSLLKPDGIHPNRLGNYMLKAHLQHAVQSYPRD